VDDPRRKNSNNLPKTRNGTSFVRPRNSFLRHEHETPAVPRVDDGSARPWAGRLLGWHWNALLHQQSTCNAQGVPVEKCGSRDDCRRCPRRIGTIVCRRRVDDADHGKASFRRRVQAPHGARIEPRRQQFTITAGARPIRRSAEASRHNDHETGLEAWQLPVVQTP
jgi:hypothetical protein